MTQYSATLAAELTVADGGTRQLSLAVRLQGDDPLADWQLHFDLPKRVRAGEGTLLLRQTGSHVVLAPECSEPLEPGQPQQLLITVDASAIQRLSDLPAGIYLRNEDRTLPCPLVLHNLETLVDLSVTGASLSAASVNGAQAAHAVTPHPAHVSLAGGEAEFTGPLSWQGLENDSADARRWIATATGVEPQPDGTAESTTLVFSYDERLGAEGYTLSVQPELITLEAASAAGFFYAAVTLTQLGRWQATGCTLPLVTVEDTPRFGHRGFMLDCARNFHSVDVILELLELLARYKLNRFHWHLTDDEGWRLEILAFPELTETGAWRGDGLPLDSQFGSGPEPYGGYYTQDDVRRVVARAAQLQITVIPEIDIPGHSRAAVKALPVLLQEPADISSYLSVQLYNDNVLNPALPGTYTFLDAVLEEVCALFPGDWVHIGGDEVPEGVWIDSPACRQMMTEHGYDSALDLQCHLFRHAQRFLADRGKQLLGWEESAHGEKLKDSAIICCWSAPDSAAKTAAMGYPVIACAAQHTYLDLAWGVAVEEPGLYWAGAPTLAECYAYEAEVDGLEVLGIQAQLWSELVATRERLHYMVFPRLLAVAELAWSPRNHRDLAEFTERARVQSRALEALGVNGRPLELDHDAPTIEQ